MKRIVAILCTCFFSVALFAGATIEGVVKKASGSRIPPPPAGRYKPTVDPIGKPDPIQAVVYLEGSFPKTNVATVVEVKQQGYQFRPGIVAIQKGTEISFPNFDNEYHSVLSLSKPKRFNLGRFRKDEKPPLQKFDKLGKVDLFCEIHSHMRGTILVLDTPYKTTTDPVTGKYQLENLPPGKHTLKMWLDGRDDVSERTVELRDGETVTVDFE